MVYLAGRIDLKNREETQARFDRAEKLLKGAGFEVYNPAKMELGEFSREELAERDFNMLDESDVLFVVTDKMSLGTTIELGYFTAKKRLTGRGKIVVVYLGDEEYKFTSLFDFMKNYSPMTVYVDYFTQSIEDGVRALKNMV